MGKWFMGRLKNDEFVLYHNGELIRAVMAYLPKYIDFQKQLVLKCNIPLLPEQYEALKDAWEIFNAGGKAIVLEGPLELEVCKT